MNTDTENWTLENWLYLGNYGDDGKVGVKFQILGDENAPIGDVLKFTPKKRMSLAVGGIYRVEVLRAGSDNVTARVAGAKFVGLHKDGELRRELEIKQRIFTEDERNRRLEKKHRNGFALPDDWAEIVRLYKKLNRSQQRTFENLVIAKLRTEGDTF